MAKLTRKSVEGLGFCRILGSSKPEYFTYNSSAYTPFRVGLYQDKSWRVTQSLAAAGAGIGTLEELVHLLCRHKIAEGKQVQIAEIKSALGIYDNGLV